jgi:hypothetical protein
LRASNASKIAVKRGKTYKAKSNGAGCFSDYSNSVITDLEGIVAAESLIEYGPNPSSGTLNIRARVGELTVRIRDVSGKEICTQVINGEKATIELKGSGLYFLEVKTEKFIAKPVKIVVL